jgi:hypothetical protein
VGLGDPPYPEVPTREGSVALVFGGALMFLSRVTAAPSVSPRIACAELDGGVVAVPDANEAVVVGENRTEGPTLTR